MAIIRRIQSGRKVRYFSGGMVTDRADNCFDALIWNDGTDTGTVVEIYLTTPAGVQVLVDRHHSEAGKFDTVAMCQVGRHLRVRPTAHEGDFVTNEQEYWVRDVCVPYLAGEVPLGGSGTLQPAEDNGGGGGITPEQIQEIAAATVTALREQFGGAFRDVLESKAKDAQVELMNYNHEDGKSRQFLDRLAPFVRDRAYEANVAYHGPRNADDEELLARLAEAETFAHKVQEMEANNGD